jgi:hypothetical protein
VIWRILVQVQPQQNVPKSLSQQKKLSVVVACLSSSYTENINRRIIVHAEQGKSKTLSQKQPKEKGSGTDLT